MRILVTGATGTLGGALLPALLRAGHQVRALSRKERGSSGRVEWVWGDLVSGKGVPDAVHGVDAIAHLATSGPKGRGAVDVPGTHRLLLAAREARVPHLLYTSIVGVDRAAIGHLRHKLEAERLIGESGIGWTVLRATRYQQSLDQRLRAYASVPVMLVDRSLPWQPVHTGEVAALAASLLASGPEGREYEFGGPEVMNTEELVRTWLEARNVRRPCLPVHYPGRLYAAQRDGELTTDADSRGIISWRDYLHPAPPALSDDFASEHTASPTSPANQPENDPDLHVYGGDEGYERPTRS
ncbi:NAD-dependent epimerase/dehydratase family protein [Nonomuraea longispora]|uniref:NAD-dependent epimerase/dehydratase family protein n=1 Tax=Nonomuraea longispora TaxID=1848320 RepID=A0A4R4MW74_9ACTN|nr:NAD(P)H-binding protein [Nonomuraea longispora]TDC00501.1 NAD-dependent epimerase/dehydratase family protein [Nonomuraea longispora]